MEYSSRIPSFELAARIFAAIIAFVLLRPSANAQWLSMYGVGDSATARLDFAQVYLDQEKRRLKTAEEEAARKKELVDSGAVSALDLEVSNKAVEEFNRANSLRASQKSKEAIVHFRKAIAAAPRFVSAHIGIGLAYLDQDNYAGAKTEFELAAKLDDKFAGSFLNLGLLALSLKDFGSAQSELERAVSLRPADPRTLSALAYAQHGNRRHLEVLETAQRVHALEHSGMANVHYVAAASANTLGNLEVAQHELGLFLSEDASHPLAPAARRYLDGLAQREAPPGQPTAVAGRPQVSAPDTSVQVQTFPNSDRLKAELGAVGEESGGETCDTCGAAGSREMPVQDRPRPPAAIPDGMWTIRKAVDEVAVFFSASSRGRMVNDLEPSDIQIRDDNKPPEKVLQFTPQSKLPLRLALLVDTSGSVQNRFSFEKRAAEQFVRDIIRSSTDLGFVIGFAHQIRVTQDFSADTKQLNEGIEQLTNGGGTSLFDAVSLACWKLAAYPENERVARVLVILSDGEDNSSHGSLKQSIKDAEATDVTVYAVSTRQDVGPKTDADKVLRLFAERTGGEALFPGDVSALQRSLNSLRDLIRSRYLVAYRPADFVPDGRYRSLQIIAEKAGKRVQVHARGGYTARRAEAYDSAPEKEY